MEGARRDTSDGKWMIIPPTQSRHPDVSVLARSPRQVSRCRYRDARHVARELFESGRVALQTG